MDATCRRRRCADNNAADGGRTMTIHRTQTNEAAISVDGRQLQRDSIADLIECRPAA